MKNLVKVIFVAILGGALPVFIKIALNVIPPFTFIFIRFCLAFIVLLPLFLKQIKIKNIRKNIKKRQVIIISLLGALNIMFAALGIQRTLPSMSQMLYSTVPVFTSLFSYIFLNQGLSRKQASGLLIGLVGVSIIILSPLLKQNIKSGGSLLGNLLVFLAVISYSIYTVISKRAQENTPSIIIMMSVILATLIIQLFMIPFELSIRPIHIIISSLDMKTIIAVLYVGLIGTAAYHFLYLRLIKSTSPLIASLVLYLQPIFTIFISMILIKDKLNTAFIIGSGFALLGAYLVSSKNSG